MGTVITASRDRRVVAGEEIARQPSALERATWAASSSQPVNGGRPMLSVGLAQVPITARHPNQNQVGKGRLNSIARQTRTRHELS